MADVTRDDLAEVLRATRDEATALGGVRVEMATLNGNVETLTTEVRIQIGHVMAEQIDQATELAAVQSDVRDLQQWQWKVAGGIGVVGILAGGLGAQLLG